MRAPLAILLSAIPFLVGATAPAQADPGRSAKTRILGYVVAESRYGAATIAAPVRLNAVGRREVRLPGGTWIECRRSCANTLRQETIDFWHARANGDATGDDGPGYFTYSFRY